MGQKTLTTIILLSVAVFLLAAGVLSYRKTDQFLTKPLMQPYIALLSPNGGEILYTGTSAAITWKSEGVEKICGGLVQGGKQFGEDLLNVPAELGRYEWKVPDMSGWELSGVKKDAYQFFIYNCANGDIRDVSEKTFTITK